MDYRVRRSMKYIVSVWIAIFLVSCAGAVSPATPSQIVTAQLLGTATFVSVPSLPVYALSDWTGIPAVGVLAAVVTDEAIGENYNIKAPENAQRVSQGQDNGIVAHRVSRGRHFLYFCCSASTLLNDYVGSSHKAVVQMDGTGFFLLIENNANAPPLYSDEIL